MRKGKNYQSLIINREQDPKLKRGQIFSSFRNRDDERKSSTPNLKNPHSLHEKLPSLYKYSGKKNTDVSSSFKKSIFTVKLKRAKSLRSEYDIDKEVNGITDRPTLPTLASLRADLKNHNKDFKRMRSKYLSKSKSDASTIIGDEIIEDNKSLFYGGADWKSRINKISLKKYDKDDFRKLADIKLEDLDILKSTEENLALLGKSLESGLLYDICNNEQQFASLNTK